MIYLFEDRKGRMEQYLKAHLDSDVIKVALIDCGKDNLADYLTDNFSDSKAIIFHSSYSFNDKNITNEDVKKYAKMLIEDHSRSLEELKTLANENTITMPASISEAGSEKYNQLNELSGDDFDRKFVGMVLEEHEKGVGIMTAISQNATNEDFKLWASRQTSVFVKHYEEAKMLKEKFGELNN